MADPRDLHAWSRRNLVLLQAGLLSETEEARLRTHLRECPECGKDLGPLMTDAPDPSTFEHIPPQMIARWKEAQGSLRGLTRAMVRHHLQRCAECRQDLEALGFKPVLDVVPELETPVETEAAARQTDATSAPPSSPHTIRIVKPGRRASWIVGTWAAAATVVATVLLVSPSGDREARPPAPTPARPAEPPRFVLDVLPAVGVLQGVLRGDPGAPPTRIEIGSDTRFVHLALPEVFLDDTVTVTLRVVGPDERELLVARRRYDALFHGRSLVFGSEEAPLPPGDYRLVVSTPFHQPPEVAAYRFRLAR